MGLPENRRLIVVIGASLIIILIAIGLYTLMSNPSSTYNPPTGTLPAGVPDDRNVQNVTGPANGKYLINQQGGEATRIYLINSSFNYGTFDRDYTWPPTGYLAKKGEPCIIINGTIRNDYDSDLYIGLTAYAYNSSGDKAGRIVSTDPGEHWRAFTTYHVQSKSAEPFRIYIKYNKTDVERYEIYAAFMPTATAPP